MKSKKSRKRFSKDDAELTLLALPTFVWYIIFSYLPMIGIIIAFKDFQIIPNLNFFQSLVRSDWVGLLNFKFLLKTPDLPIIIRNTLVYNIIFIVLGIIIPVFLAIALSQVNSKKLAKVCQTSIFLPNFLSWVVVSYFVFAFLSYDKGIVNQILSVMGLHSIQWYQSKQYWPFILVFMNMWKTTGYNTVIYLAAITAVDFTYYEAALIDGATKWQQIKNITIPFIKPVIVILFILSVGHIFNSDFGLFYQVPRNSGSLYNATETIDTYIFKAIEGTGSIAMSSAAAFFQSIIGFGTIIAANAIVKKVDRDNSLF